MEPRGDELEKTVFQGSYHYSNIMHTPVRGALSNNPIADFNAALNIFQNQYCIEQNILSVGSADFHDFRYQLNVVDLGTSFRAVPEIKYPSKDFPDMLSRRKSEPCVTKSGICPSVGTSYVMILDVYDGKKHLGKYMALTTRDKAEGLWGAAISGYVKVGNIDKNEGLDVEKPVSKTMQNEVHEEAILMSPNGDWVHWHFPNQDKHKVNIFDKEFDYSSGKIEVRDSELPAWLPCSKCSIEGRDSHIFLNPDPKNNSGQFVDCGIAKINLQDKLSLIHSESAATSKEVNGEKITVIEERVNSNGIILMELDKSDNPTGKFKKLVMGELIDVESPATLSELFSIKQEEHAFGGMEYSFPIAVAKAPIVYAYDFLAKIRGSIK